MPSGLPKNKLCARTTATLTNRSPAGATRKSSASEGRCRGRSALACSRRCKHWTNLTRDRKVRPRNQRTTPNVVAASVRVHRFPKTENDMHELRPPSLIPTRMSPLQNTSDHLSEVHSGLQYPRKHTYTIATRRSLAHRLLYTLACRSRMTSSHGR